MSDLRQLHSFSCMLSLIVTVDGGYKCTKGNLIRWTKNTSTDSSPSNLIVLYVSLDVTVIIAAMKGLKMKNVYVFVLCIGCLATFDMEIYGLTDKQRHLLSTTIALRLVFDIEDSYSTCSKIFYGIDELLNGNIDIDYIYSAIVFTNHCNRENVMLNDDINCFDNIQKENANKIIDENKLSLLRFCLLSQANQAKLALTYVFIMNFKCDNAIYGCGVNAILFYTYIYTAFDTALSGVGIHVVKHLLMKENVWSSI